MKGCIAKQPARSGYCYDAENDGPWYLAGGQCNDEGKAQQGRGGRETGQCSDLNEGCGIVDDDPGVLQCYEGQE